MMPVRRSAAAGVLLIVTLTGCDSSRGDIVTVASSGFSNTTVRPATSPAATSPASTPASAPTTPPAHTGTPSLSVPAASSVAAPRSTAIAIPAHLCSGMDAAQNAADAYMGALSAGNAAEAMACVLPNTVPPAVTRSLLATSGATALYLPREGVNGPSVFGYQGNGKVIDVTVGKQSGGQFRVTKVAVRSG